MRRKPDLLRMLKLLSSDPFSAHYSVSYPNIRIYFRYMAYARYSIGVVFRNAVIIGQRATNLRTAKLKLGLLVAHLLTMEPDL